MCLPPLSKLIANVPLIPISPPVPEPDTTATWRDRALGSVLLIVALWMKTKVPLRSSSVALTVSIATYTIVPVFSVVWVSISPLVVPTISPEMTLSIVILPTPILTVDQLAAKACMSVRSLQRLFKEYVGVPPKWVIRRYRLHELVERLHSGKTFDGAKLALDLGYADQAHLGRVHAI